MTKKGKWKFLMSDSHQQPGNLLLRYSSFSILNNNLICGFIKQKQRSSAVVVYINTMKMTFYFFYFFHAFKQQRQETREVVN